MGVDVRILTAALALLAATTTTSAQDVFGERCGYMNEIPRPKERPVIPPIHYEGLTWNQRPLVPAADRLDLCMDAFILDQTVPNRGNQFIFMEEEIEGHVPIAKLNYNGENTPTVQVPILTGQFNLLLPIITKIDGDWHVVITNRQDFETPGMQFYSFNIVIAGEAMVATVSLMIVNIDDNDPIIQMLAPCEIPEGGEPGETDCVYVVSDADGRLSTSAMHFEIISDRGDEQIFELVRQNHPNEWGWCYMVLFLKERLDFVDNPMHIFRAWAYDSKRNSHDVSMMVEVENVESRPPVWVEIFPMQRFDEKIKRSFRVRAIDGDTGIRKPIHYRLVTEKEEEDLFELETRADGVWLNVGPIDRDALEKEVFELTIVAYKYGDNDVEGSPSFETPAEIVIIIDDINDQRPVPLRADGIYNIDIMEETAMTLDLQDFGFHDRDLGPRAQYRVHLDSVYPEGVHTAFYVAPEVGYQRQSFILGTQDHHRLDYDNTTIDFKKIQIRAVAVDMDDNNMIGVAIININLINWNDELPIFKLEPQTVEFDETVGKDFHVGTVLAEDLDIGDRVEHSLMGNAIDFLRIDKASGEIFVKDDDVFNYHRQNEVFIQVRAVDTFGAGPHHTATTQLIIRLKDINNTPPVLRLPRSSPHVDENKPPGFPITNNVTATDPDTTAELWFEIDWKTSYATKQGRETPEEEFHNCVEILTRYPDENIKGVAYGVLEVRKIRPGIGPLDPPVTIDYEEFEVLYLTVRVRDKKTVIGDDYDESTFTITIVDLNDNRPIWGAGQLEQQFRVREMALSGVVIGSMHATDIDGPLYNQVRYTIEPKDGTPPDLVAIDFNTGQITVQENQRIDADVPQRFNLYYTVTASDKCSMKNQSQCPIDKTYWDTATDISIHIIDTNNKVPVLETDKFNTTVWIYEDADTGADVVTLIASDLDRDLPNSNVSFTINYMVDLRIRDFFEVDLVTGQVRVYYTGPDRLDRDGDEPEHTIFFTIIDNFASEGDGNRNQIEGQVHVILLDVNDNEPVLPSPDEFPPWTVSESTLQGIRIEPEIFAPDRDEPGTDNSRVAYAILSLTTDRDIVVPTLFNMITIETYQGIDQTGELETAMPLQGYWGTYDIHILAYDHGDPVLSSNETYQIVVRPYNFHTPEFVFPKPGSVIRLSRERAIVSGVLTVVGAAATPLERISATDEDGLHAGTVNFSVVGDDAAADYFDVWNDGENSGMLTLTQPLPEGLQEFQLTIRATDGGDEPGPKSTDSAVTVAFIPQGEPEFLNNTQDVAFIELTAGMLERFALSPATDPKNFLCDEDVDCYVIHYTIIDGNSAGHFALDGNVLFLRSQLNRDEHVTHTLRVAASNVPGVTTAPPASTLTVTVTVREASPRPHFERPLYTAGISTTDSVETDRPLITVQATHTEGLDFTYSIDQESMEVDPSLESVQERAFELNPVTGELRRMIQPTATMHGMFEFDIVATDTNGATGHSHVKVYLISSRNRVYFTFYNEQDQVITHRDFIADTFSRVYNLVCNIDQIVARTDTNGVAITTETDVMAHFIRDDLPVSADEISELQTNSQLYRDVETALSEQDLNLRDVSAGTPFLPGGDNALAVYILAGLAGLLAVLCIVLLVSFIIRNRALNRRIAALSMTKYSSVDSGLNRIGLAAPGTNKHAVEGSNPIWNETIKAPDFDAISEQSNDSDLIGIEDHPQFRNDYFPPEFDRDMRNNDPEDPEEIGARNPIANHENNFGFNTSPFSPGFANSQLRR